MLGELSALSGTVLLRRASEAKVTPSQRPSPCDWSLTQGYKGQTTSALLREILKCHSASDSQLRLSMGWIAVNFSPDTVTSSLALHRMWRGAPLKNTFYTKLHLSVCFLENPTSDRWHESSEDWSQSFPLQVPVASSRRCKRCTRSEVLKMWSG